MLDHSCFAPRSPAIRLIVYLTIAVAHPSLACLGEKQVGPVISVNRLYVGVGGPRAVFLQVHSMLTFSRG